MKEASDKDVVEEKNRTTMEWIHSGVSGALNRTYIPTLMLTIKLYLRILKWNYYCVIMSHSVQSVLETHICVNLEPTDQ